MPKVLTLKNQASISNELLFVEPETREANHSPSFLLVLETDCLFIKGRCKTRNWWIKFEQQQCVVPQHAELVCCFSLLSLGFTTGLLVCLIFRATKKETSIIFPFTSHGLHCHANGYRFVLVLSVEGIFCLGMGGTWPILCVVFLMADELLEHTIRISLFKINLYYNLWLFSLPGVFLFTLLSVTIFSLLYLAIISLPQLLSFII